MLNRILQITTFALTVAVFTPTSQAQGTTESNYIYNCVHENPSNGLPTGVIAAACQVQWYVVSGLDAFPNAEDILDWYYGPNPPKLTFFGGGDGDDWVCDECEYDEEDSN